MILTLALLLDAALGEPDWLWTRMRHPAVLMGDGISWADGRFNNGADRKTKGVWLVVALVVISVVVATLLRSLPMGWLVELIVAAILLAQRSLVDHVRAVAEGLREGLVPGREAVAMIVGRDVAALDGSGVARGAIESGAENFSDGVVAPAFWFLVLGLPGMLAYKAINTADSMIGYKTEAYRDFGWAAAKLDDLVNWVPARVSAVLILAAGMRLDRMAEVVGEAPKHRSPNAGWPEAAMARVLGVALSGPRSYGGVLGQEPFVNPDGRKDLDANDIDACCRILWLSWGLMLALILGVTILW